MSTDSDTHTYAFLLITNYFTTSYDLLPHTTSKDDGRARVRANASECSGSEDFEMDILRYFVSRLQLAIG